MAEAETRYWWWALTDILAMLWMFVVASVKVGPRNVRMEFHPHDTGAELKVATVVGGGREVCGEYNFGHTCPPACG
jgi:hypothetical protein